MIAKELTMKTITRFNPKLNGLYKSSYVHLALFALIPILNNLSCNLGIGLDMPISIITIVSSKISHLD